MQYRLALSSAVPPSALCPGNIQTAYACTMPYDAHTKDMCTCPPPCLSWGAPSSMLCPPSAWPCSQCSSCFCFLIAAFFFPLALAFTLDDISKLIVKLEVSLESIELSQHGHNLIIVEGLAPHIPLVLR